MKQTLRVVQSVATFLQQQFRRDWKAVAAGAPDPRSRQGKQWGLHDLQGNLLLGRLSGRPTLEEVEMETDLAHEGPVSSFGKGRTPDTTGHDLLKVTGEDLVNHLTGKLADRWQRNKKLFPVRSRNICGELANIVGYDGQHTISEKEERPFPYVRTKHMVTRGSGDNKVTEERYYWRVDMAHAILVSGPADCLLRQRVVRNGDEVGAVRALDGEVMAAHPWLHNRPLLKVADALHANRAFVKAQGDPHRELADQGNFFLFTLKSNTGAPYTEGKRALWARLDRGDKFEAQTDFENSGHGRQTKREILTVQVSVGLSVPEAQSWRLSPFEAILSEEDWPNVRQLVLVKQTTRFRDQDSKDQFERQRRKRRRSRGEPEDKDSPDSEEHGLTVIQYRYFMTNAKPADISSDDLLYFVRAIWRHESYHNLLNQIFKQHKRRWATVGLAPVAIAGLCCLALNFAGMLRNRHLRANGNRERVTYRQLVFIIFALLAGGAISKVLGVRQTQKPDEELDDELAEALDDNALARDDWSAAQVEHILAAVKVLFGYLLPRFLDCRALQLQLAGNPETGDMELTLKLS